MSWSKWHVGTIASREAVDSVDAGLMGKEGVFGGGGQFREASTEILPHKTVPKIIVTDVSHANFSRYHSSYCVASPLT